MLSDVKMFITNLEYNILFFSIYTTNSDKLQQQDELTWPNGRVQLHSARCHSSDHDTH